MLTQNEIARDRSHERHLTSFEPKQGKLTPVTLLAQSMPRRSWVLVIISAMGLHSANQVDSVLTLAAVAAVLWITLSHVDRRE